MKFRAKTFSASIAVISALTTAGIISRGAFAENSRFSASTPKEAESSVVIHGEVANIYGEISQLGKQADLIVVGKFQGEPTFRPEVLGSDYPPRADSEALVPTDRDPSLVAMNRLPYREMNFQVSTVIKGESLLGGLSSPSVTVEQVGILDAGREVGVSGDRLFQANEEYVLFLSPDPLGQRYFVTGISQGAFLLKDGMVSSLNTLEGVDNIGPTVRAQPLTTFLSTIQRAIGLPL